MIEAVKGAVKEEVRGLLLVLVLLVGNRGNVIINSRRRNRKESMARITEE